AALHDAMNIVWRVPGRAGLRGILHQRVIAFLMVLGIGALLVLMVMANTALNFALNTYSRIAPESEILPGNEQLLGWANMLLSFAVVTIAFAMLYKYVPDARIEWRDVWVGAVITAILFTLGKTLIGWYLGTSAMQSVYGAAA